MPRPGQGLGRRPSLAKAQAHHPRHTQTLWNVAHKPLVLLGRAQDTLWSQALAPLEDPREQAGSRTQILHTLASDPDYVRAYGELFGPLPDPSDTERFPLHARPVPAEHRHPHAVAWGLMSAEDRAAVDRVFVTWASRWPPTSDASSRATRPSTASSRSWRAGATGPTRAIGPGAQRGFAIFVGKGRCHFCHDGPNFSDGEFHTNRFPTEEGVDPGRPLGIRQLLRDPFNTRSAFADDGGEVGRLKLSFPRIESHLPGEFKTPTLRNVAETAPYMHEGQLRTLEEVIAFYSTLQGAAPAPIHGENLIQPLGLTEKEQADLLAFLESLTGEPLPAEPARPAGDALRSLTYRDCSDST